MEIVSKLILVETIYWGSFLVFPFLALLYYKRYKIPRVMMFILLLLSISFIWSRFIETQIITVNETVIQSGFNGNIALIADTHLGAFKSEKFLKRVVEKINQQDIDYVFIAGDFTYEPNPDELDKLFSVLENINKPVYAVLGNHDVERPGQPIRKDLVKVLKDNNLTILNNDIVVLNDFVLVGLGDAWTAEDNVEILENISTDKSVVVLAHNPDTISKYTNSNADITLTGHTHCGQIRIPFLYKYVIPTEGNFDKGLTSERFTKLFITCGLGEVGLPMRLFNPPVIDVLKFEKKSK